MIEVPGQSLRSRLEKKGPRVIAALVPWFLHWVLHWVHPQGHLHRSLALVIGHESWVIGMV